MEKKKALYIQVYSKALLCLIETMGKQYISKRRHVGAVIMLVQNKLELIP